MRQPGPRGKAGEGSLRRAGSGRGSWSFPSGSRCPVPPAGIRSRPGRHRAGGQCPRPGYEDVTVALDHVLDVDGNLEAHVSVSGAEGKLAFVGGDEYAGKSRIDDTGGKGPADSCQLGGKLVALD